MDIPTPTLGNVTPANPSNSQNSGALSAGQFGNTLPAPAKTPVGPTGVATSDLADQTLGTQKQGVDTLSASVQQHAANKSANGGVLGNRPDISIVDLLNSKGQASDFTTRAKLAAQAGIKDYTGSADQNKQLIGFVNNGSGNQQNGTQVEGTQTTTGTNNGAPIPGPMSGGSSTGIPEQPTTGSPGDVYSTILDITQKQIAEATDGWRSQTQQILNGTFPLNPWQQQSIDATKAKFDEIEHLQMVANKSYEGGVGLASARSGVARQAPKEAMAESAQAVTDGLRRINVLDAEASKTLADLHQSFLDKDYTMINDNYTALRSTLEDKAKAITDLQTRTDKLYTDARDYNEKLREFNLDYQQKQSQFAQTMSLERAKFSAQYAGLIDPVTGAFKPTADPTQLPGVNTLPASLGTGTAAHYFDPAQIADKGLATYLTQAAKQAGFGVVDTSNNKTFNQSLSALSGLDSLIKSGSVDPNAKITDVIGNKKSTSLILRVFGSTQPDNISQVLGAGGASVPNLKDLTLNQAAAYLKSNIYSTMGTNTTAQKYAMNPEMASSDLQTYFTSSPINALAVEKSYSSFPNLTPSQRMQLLNGQ